MYNITDLILYDKSKSLFLKWFVLKYYYCIINLRRQILTPLSLYWNTKTVFRNLTYDISHFKRSIFIKKFGIDDRVCSLVPRVTVMGLFHEVEKSWWVTLQHGSPGPCGVGEVASTNDLNLPVSRFDPGTMIRSHNLVHRVLTTLLETSWFYKVFTSMSWFAWNLVLVWVFLYFILSIFVHF